LVELNARLAAVVDSIVEDLDVVDVVRFNAVASAALDVKAVVRGRM
jgi:hypothetical protein